MISQWRTVDRLVSLAPGEYCLWHRAMGPLDIPSGDHNIADALAVDPCSGWLQRLENPEADTPWLGSNLPGPYGFRFRPSGKEATDSLGPSGFSWLKQAFVADGGRCDLERPQLVGDPSGR